MRRAEDWLMKNSPRILTGLLAIVVVLIGVAVYILIQYQPKTACQTNPQGRECQQIKVESDKARTPRSACVITRLAGLGCPALEDRRAKAKDNEKRQPEGDTNAPSTQGTSSNEGSTVQPQSSGPPSGSGGGGGSAGGGVVEPPVDPPAPEPQEPSPPASPPSPSPEPPAQSPSPSVGQTVDGVIGTVDDATGGVVCSLPVALCP